MVQPVEGNQATAIGFQGPQGFLKCFFKRSAQRHRLTNRFHLCRERGIGTMKFFKGKSRNLDDNVVDRGFKGGLCHLGNVIGNFIEGIPDGQFCRNFRNRKSGGLGGQG